MPNDSVSNIDSIMDTSYTQRKRQFVDSEGFTLPQKFAKVSGQIEKPTQVETSNMFDALARETAVTGLSWSSVYGSGYTTLTVKM